MRQLPHSSTDACLNCLMRQLTNAWWTSPITPRLTHATMRSAFMPIRFSHVPLWYSSPPLLCWPHGSLHPGSRVPLWYPPPLLCWPHGRVLIRAVGSNRGPIRLTRRDSIGWAQDKWWGTLFLSHSSLYNINHTKHIVDHKAPLLCIAKIITLRYDSH